MLFIKHFGDPSAEEFSLSPEYFYSIYPLRTVSTMNQVSQQLSGYMVPLSESLNALDKWWMNLLDDWWITSHTKFENA